MSLIHFPSSLAFLQGSRDSGEDTFDQMKGAAFLILVLVILPLSGYGEMYQWVDEKGDLHFADDLSKVPERYRPDVKLRETLKEGPPEAMVPEPPSASGPKALEPEAFQVDLMRRGEVWTTEVLLNGRVKQAFIVDTGASFTLINQQTAKELELVVDEMTPFVPVSTASNVILTPLVTMRSLRVGEAEAENVGVLVHDMPSSGGLLGNSFLNRFRVVIDSASGKMTLYSLQGKPSLDRPGGYGKGFWVSQFRFIHDNLRDLKKLKERHEKTGLGPGLSRIHNGLRYFENQLNELERKASLAGVPRNWRE